MALTICLCAGSSKTWVGETAPGAGQASPPATSGHQRCGLPATSYSTASRCSVSYQLRQAAGLHGRS